MNNTGKGQFVKGHIPIQKGKSKWGFGVCICGKEFKIYNRKRKGKHELQKFCSKSCGMKGNKRAKEYMTGRKIPLKTRKKMSEAQKKRVKEGRHPAWKGGITPINEAIRKSLEYKLWREAVFARDNYTCVWCGRRGKEIHADHIKPFALFPELRFSIDNGRTLCKPCHLTTDTYGHNTR